MFSKFFRALSAGKKVAFLAVFTALSVVTNVLSIDVGTSNKLAFTYLSCFMSAYFLGAVPAFLIAFLGDTIGFFINSQGGVFWLFGVTLGIFAFLCGVGMHYLPFHSKKGEYVKTAIVVVVCYVVVTLILNTVVSYYYAKIFFWGGQAKKTIFVYLAGRIGFQSVVYLVNAVLCFVFLPLMQLVAARYSGKKPMAGGITPKES